MNKSVTLDLWETIIGEKDFSSFSKTRREIKAHYAYEYLLKFSDSIDYSDVLLALDFVTYQINVFSRFHSDRLFKNWLEIFINKIDTNLINKLDNKENEQQKLDKLSKRILQQYENFKKNSEEIKAELILKK